MGGLPLFHAGIQNRQGCRFTPFGHDLFTEISLREDKSKAFCCLMVAPGLLTWACLCLVLEGAQPMEVESSSIGKRSTD